MIPLAIITTGSGPRSVSRAWRREAIRARDAARAELTKARAEIARFRTIIDLAREVHECGEAHAADIGADHEQVAAAARAAGSAALDIAEDARLKMLLLLEAESLARQKLEHCQAQIRETTK